MEYENMFLWRNKAKYQQGTVNVLKFSTPKFLTKWHMQKVQTHIRLLLKEQSDLGLHCLPVH